MPDDDELPFVVMTEIGNLPDNGIALRIMYATRGFHPRLAPWRSNRLLDLKCRVGH
jgi:hypothetical protein